MAYTATIKDGKVVDTSATSLSDSTQKKTTNDSLDKQAFLQLLVAQMQYQDPLEPMDNTEYVSQLATFSELEAMNNLNDSMTLQRASQMVGQNVIMRTTSSTTGETYMTQGVVDYVVYENGKAYLAINEELFSIDDLDTILSDEYWENYQQSGGNNSEDSSKYKDVTELVLQIAKLPKSEDVKLSDKEAIQSAREAYEALSDENKTMVDNDAVYYLIKAEAALAKLEAEDKKNNPDAGDGAETETDIATDDSEK